MIQGISHNKNRVFGLDIFRISLVLLIFLFHSHIHIGCSYGIFNYFVSRGAIAMTAFFMLSGYSLTLVYGKQDILAKEALKTFYSKRCFSLLPQYFVLAFLYIIILGDESVLENIILFPVELFGLQSTYCSLFGVTHNSGTWFISCLIICYLLYPFFQHITTLISDKYIVILVSVLSFILLWGPIVQLYFGTSTLYDNPFYRVVEFYIGLLIAHLNITENISG
ncbi:MAG: acyltransferase family protein, partial [Paludibacteraceae bacterium]|nr:acyltransferase family protein [Paludibacteraceae bacterium]